MKPVYYVLGLLALLMVSCNSGTTEHTETTEPSSIKVIEGESSGTTDLPPEVVEEESSKEERVEYPVPAGKESLNEAVLNIFELAKQRELETLSATYIHPEYKAWVMYWRGAGQNLGKMEAIEAKGPSSGPCPLVRIDPEFDLFSINWKKPEIDCEKGGPAHPGLYVSGPATIDFYTMSTSMMHTASTESDKDDLTMLGTDVYEVILTEPAHYEPVFYVKEIEGSWKIVMMDVREYWCGE